MRTRDLAILCGSLCLCAAAGIAFLSQDTYAVELLPPGASQNVAPAAGPSEATPMAPELPAPAANGDLVPAAAPVVATVGSDKVLQLDTSDWTKGIIRGDIQLSTAVLDRITSITVVVEEARSSIRRDNTFDRAHKLVVPVKLGVGTPVFEVADVPFSDYPYVVSVHAPGLNGGRSTVSIDRDHPIVTDIVLRITPGTPYSVLVRDQESTPYGRVDLSMQPVGEPLGRPGYKGTTDNFGSFVFDDVLAGDYQLVASATGQPLAPAHTVNVMPGTYNASRAVLGQNYTLTIPRGIPVRIAVHDPNGYPIPDAKVTATASDRIRLTEVALTTDYGGFADFSHLQAGVWAIVVEKEGCQRVDFQLHLKAGQEPVQRSVKLVGRR